jgi:uncharacterized protein YciI
VAYVLVILRAGPKLDQEQRHAGDHERFIDSLIGRNLVLLGGAFARAVCDAYAGYVLRCGGIEEARELAAQDPFVAHGVLQPELVEWELVGINPEAIDDAAVVTPSDIG